jgi:hypothetical protein
MENMLETTADWFRFYETLKEELREKLKLADPHDQKDFRLNELCDLDVDAQRQIQGLCKRIQTLKKRIDFTFPPNACGEPRLPAGEKL